MTEPQPVTPEISTAPATPEAASQNPETATQDVSTLPEWARTSLTKANQEAAKYRTQLAELKPKADQFTALEEASKSEAQRLAEAAETARRDAEAARSEAIRYKAAATHGIGADHFDLLGSGSEAEITARAEKIAALVAAQAAIAATTTVQPTRPVEQLRPGATPAAAVSEDDAVFAALFGPPK